MNFKPGDLVSVKDGIYMWDQPHLFNVYLLIRVPRETPRWVYVLSSSGRLGWIAEWDMVSQS
jgi:hypothetical protein